MRIDRLVDLLTEFSTIDRNTIFTCIEEMKVLGYNILNLIIDLGLDIEYAALSFRYVALDELEPIAIVMQPKKDKVMNLDLDLVLKILHKYGGYLYGNQENMGFLVPVREDNLQQILNKIIPKMIERMFGYVVKLRIVGCTYDFYHDR